MADPADDGAPGPKDPMTAMAEGAAQLHEMFSAFVAAGFTEAQALQLVGAILSGTLGGNR